MENLSPYTQVIQQVYPDLAINAVDAISHGRNNTVLDVNDQFIFRFPKYIEGLHALKQEITLLKYIQGRISLATPEPEFICLADLSGAFMGYPKIPGEPLWNNLLSNASSTTQGNLAKQLGEFLSTLHRLSSITELATCLPRNDTASQWTEIFRRIRTKLIPHMRPDAQTWIISHFERFLNEPKHFAYKPVLKHGDFGTSNILFDQTTNSISGIIDFSNASLGDPAYDFAGLLSSYGENFVYQASCGYPNFEDLWPRIRFYKSTFALLEALFGIENSDMLAYESGMANYM
ncbi:6 -aminoglycoside n-acetyltransferase [Leptolyngbya sp. Heron Island J]|uniref:phosphotransferase family protein n=1 Tax=Leptolyngbya sp. Heron Island J TaxID=1385935 RepID=UPI0003B96A1E|nr:aminoglycoside phosphotransferase family protein [Leptolyngbya sp. Heron Island J]ESA32637.1 6 -aminoglycoside n-acetyltransferase [Leptolyngbya sp. Heron Island J]